MSSLFEVNNDPHLVLCLDRIERTSFLHSNCPASCVPSPEPVVSSKWCIHYSRLTHLAWTNATKSSALVRFSIVNPVSLFGCCLSESELDWSSHTLSLSPSLSALSPRQTPGPHPRSVAHSHAVLRAPITPSLSSPTIIPTCTTHDALRY